MLTNVSYNRSDRVYVVENLRSDQVVEFPAGRDGRQKAFQMGVYFHSARLYNLARDVIGRMPLLESRVWRACELVLSGAVRLVDNPQPECGQTGRAVGLVGSSNEFGDYVVRRAGRNGGGQWVCECEDFLQGMAPYDATGPRCKHSIAVEFAAELAVVRCWHCGGANGPDVMVCGHCNRVVTPF